MNTQVSIIEVGPRDGLQNVQDMLTVDQKITFIRCLLEKGFQNIEAGAFVRPDKVPAMANTDQIAKTLKDHHSKLWYLTPNLIGLQNALACKATQIAFFTAASNSFNQKNLSMGIEECTDRIHECVGYLRDQGYRLVQDWDKKTTHNREIKLRLYISTVISCPYEGHKKPQATLEIMDDLMHLGFAQVSLGDTIGVGKPEDWKKLLREIEKEHFDKNKIAMHCHDTHGTALDCVATGLEYGIRSFDSSIGGLGGCPFAPGAPGNLATEDLVFFLEKKGVDCGLSGKNLLDIFDASRTGDLVNQSKTWKALTGKKRKI